MNLLNQFSTTDWQSLASTLLHTLWQGAAIAVMLTAVLRITSTQRPNYRYLLSLTALIAVLVAGFFTWAYFDYQQSNPHTEHAQVTNQPGSSSPEESAPAALASPPLETGNHIHRLSQLHHSYLVAWSWHHAGPARNLIARS